MHSGPTRPPHRASVTCLVQLVRVDPVFVLGVDFDSRKWLEFALVERRQDGLGRAKRREMLLRLLQTPMIGVRRTIAPGRLESVGGASNRDWLVAFRYSNRGQHVKGIGLLERIRAPLCGIPDIIETSSGF